MKKFLTLSCAFLIIAVIAVGCNNKKTNTEIDNTDNTFNTTWDKVKKDYEEIENEAKNEIKDDKNITKEEIQSLVNTIETKYDSLKNGINKDNENDAKELYKAASKIEEISKVDGKKVDHEIVTLSENAKKFVKHYYGEENDIDKITNDLTTAINNVKNYTDEKWQEFLDLFK